MVQQDAPIAAAAVATGFRISLRAILMSVMSLIIALVLAVSAAGATYALFNSSATTGSSATIKSGTATLTVSTALSMPTTPMYPGATIYGSAVLTNTGDVPLAIAVTKLTGPTTSTAFSQALTIQVASATSTANCSAGVVSSSWTTSTFAAPTTGTIGTSVAKAANRVVCVAVTLPANAPSTAQSQSANNFVFTINGTQAAA